MRRCVEWVVLFVYVCPNHLLFSVCYAHLLRAFEGEDPIYCAQKCENLLWKLTLKP